MKLSQESLGIRESSSVRPILEGFSKMSGRYLVPGVSVARTYWSVSAIRCTDCTNLTIDTWPHGLKLDLDIRIDVCFFSSKQSLVTEPAMKQFKEHSTLASGLR